MKFTVSWRIAKQIKPYICGVLSLSLHNVVSQQAKPALTKLALQSQLLLYVRTSNLGHVHELQTRYRSITRFVIFTTRISKPGECEDPVLKHHSNVSPELDLMQCCVSAERPPVRARRLVLLRMCPVTWLSSVLR